MTGPATPAGNGTNAEGFGGKIGVGGIVITIGAGMAAGIDILAIGADGDDGKGAGTLLPVLSISRKSPSGSRTSAISSADKSFGNSC